MIKNQLGEYIKLKRSSRALSTGAVAEAAGVSESTVKAWEDGHSMPSPAQLEKLCAVFDCRLTQLLFGQDGADADAMLMQLMKWLYSLRALLVARRGRAADTSPHWPAVYGGHERGAVLHGASLRHTHRLHHRRRVRAFLRAFPLSPQPELSGRTAGIWCCFSIPAMIESV